MAGVPPFAPQLPSDPSPVQNVPYYDLTGGLNTKRDAHAIARNQLAASINLWYAQGNSVSKRPGNAVIATGATGTGAPGVNIVAGRFSDVTQLVVQQGTSLFAAAPNAANWGATIGSVNAAGKIRAAQLYDPDNGTGSDSLFIVDGKNTPQVWKGSGACANVSVAAGYLPKNFTGSATITPAYVSTMQAHLFYAGEPTAPTAVYISDPFFPERFSNSVYATGPNSGSYQPLLVGFNDGVNGGPITGLEPLNRSMMVYKQSAIYRLDNIALEGDLVFAPTTISTSVGCMSPKSIARFDQFHVFLGIDGVYQTDGQSTRRISDNVPTYFDGPTAVIQDRTTAVGVRYGQRYMIFFDDGAGTGSPIGHPTIGLWFDFAKLDQDGYPTVGQITGMQVSGAVSMRGPKDTGTFAWCDATADRVGQFGIGSSDFGAAISVQFSGKNDFFYDVFQSDAAIHQKYVQQAWLLVSVPSATFGQTLTFTVVCVLDNFTSNASLASSILIPSFSVSGNQVGTAIVGTAVVAGDVNSSSLQVISSFTQLDSQGYVAGLSIYESSIYPWTCLGYVLAVNIQEDTPT